MNTGNIIDCWSLANRPDGLARTKYFPTLPALITTGTSIQFLNNCIVPAGRLENRAIGCPSVIECNGDFSSSFHRTKAQLKRPPFGGGLSNKRFTPSKVANFLLESISLGALSALFHRCAVGLAISILTEQHFTWLLLRRH